MAKINGPFMSMNAVGSVGEMTATKNTTHWRAGSGHAGHTHIIKRKAKKHKKIPTPAQLAIRANVKLCAKSWKALSETRKSQWTAAGITIQRASKKGLSFKCLHGYACYLTEWFTQKIVYPAIPLLPAP